MRNDKNGYLVRLALLLEREARFQGYDIEVLTTQILEKLEKQNDKDRQIFSLCFGFSYRQPDGSIIRK